MIDAFIASFSTVALLSIAGWLSRTWIEARLKESVRLETEKILEEIKSRYAKQIALTDSRAEAYKSLWEKTKVLTPRGELQLDQSEFKCIFEDLRIWYYEHGNAMHLSLSTANDFLKGLKYLEQVPTEENLRLLKKIFSSVRTRIKEDLGIYDTTDVAAKIPDYEKPLADGTVVSIPSDNA